MSDTTMTKPRDPAADLAVCEAADEGPWLVRPGPYDDWGWIRGVATEYGSCLQFRPIVAIASTAKHLTENDKNEHRRNKTSPYAANEAFIALSRTALPYWIRRAVAAEARLRDIGSTACNALYGDDDDRREALNEINALAKGEQ